MFNQKTATAKSRSRKSQLSSAYKSKDMSEQQVILLEQSRNTAANLNNTEEKPYVAHVHNSKLQEANAALLRSQDYSQLK